MSKNFEVNTKLDFLTYIQTVEDIVAEHYDSDGNYCPHIGKAYMMQRFYELCVKSDKLAAKISDVNNSMEVIDILASDEDFMWEYDNALYPNQEGFDFANACHDAREMIEDKRSSASRITNMLENAFGRIIDKIMPAMTEETLAAVRAITENMTGGKSTAEAIVGEFVKTDRFKNIVNMKESAE